MISSLSPADQQFLAALDKIQQRAANAERQMSSGKRINTASDAPDQIGASLAARARLDATSQIRENLSRATTETDSAESALSNAVSLVERLQTLGVQASSETLTAPQRQSIGQEVEAVTTQLVNIACTSVEGRYLFSGDTDQVAPYSMTTPQDATAPVVSDYAGSASTRKLMSPNGTLFSIAHSGDQVFGTAGSSVFDAAIALRDAVEAVPAAAGGDASYSTEFHAQTAAINAALTKLGDAHDHMSGELAFYGAVQDQVAQASKDAQTIETQQKQELSSIQDADITAAILELSQAGTHQQAALEARAKLPQTTLFDYMK